MNKLLLRSILAVLVVSLVGISVVFAQGGQTPRRHCVYHLDSLQAGETVSRMSGPVCFSSLPRALSYATDGVVQLEESASPLEIQNALRNPPTPLVNYVIGIHWDYTNKGGGSAVWQGSQQCSPSIAYGVTNMGVQGWNDIAESGQGYANCNKFIQHEHINYGGALLNCTPYCSTFGVLNNQVSSFELRYN